MLQGLPWSEACERNKGPILEVLAGYLADGDRVLEIGSGTGQHAVHVAAAMPRIRWLTSDRGMNHPGIRARLARVGLANVEAPLELDTRDADWPVHAPVDAVFSANTAHIMDWPAVCGMFRGVARVLRPGGVLLLYGPFSIGGQHVSESNARFSAALQAQDPSMGVRDLDAVDVLAAQAGLTLLRRHPMPANNLIVVWQREC